MGVRKIDDRYFEVVEEKTKKHNMQSLLRDLIAMQTRIDEFVAKKAKIQELIDTAKAAGISDKIIEEDEIIPKDIQIN